MRKPIVTTFYKFNPWHTSIGEIQTIIRSFVKYSPSEFEVRLLGTENDTSQSIGVWQDAEFAGKAIRFMPLLTLPNDNFRKLVLTTIKYTAALLGRNLASDFMHFHRLEPSLAALNESNVHLLLVGDGELRDKIRSEIGCLGLSKRVTMLGAVAQADIAQLQRICNVFVLTSVYEGLPVAVLEALACGTPVVTTRCGETPNLLSTESGVVCQERKASAIADALRKVLLHPGDYPIEACVQAAEPYSARSVVSAVYSEMLSRWELKNSGSSNQTSSTTIREVAS
jgi:glycosyltransferase involved in cell wall biosynthesis